MSSTDESNTEGDHARARAVEAVYAWAVARGEDPAAYDEDRACEVLAELAEEGGPVAQYVAGMDALEHACFRTTWAAYVGAVINRDTRNH